MGRPGHPIARPGLSKRGPLPVVVHARGARLDAQARPWCVGAVRRRRVPFAAAGHLVPRLVFSWAALRAASVGCGAAGPVCEARMPSGAVAATAGYPVLTVVVVRQESATWPEARARARSR